MLTDGQKLAKGQWSSVSKVWGSERKRFAFTEERWELMVKAVEMNVGMTRAKFESGLASLTVLQ